MRKDLENLFEYHFSKWKETDDDYHHGQFVAYDKCLRLLAIEVKLLDEEQRKLVMGFSYKQKEKR